MHEQPIRITLDFSHELKHFLKELFMAKDISDRVDDIATTVNTINANLKTLIATGVKVDLTPVTNSLVTIQDTVNIIRGDVEPADQVPHVTGISPTSGSVNGGETITVTGNNFTKASTVGVMFGTVPGTNLVVVSDSSLTITSPAQAAAVVDVTVVDAAGSSAISAADQYTLA